MAKFEKYNFKKNLSYVDSKVKDEWHRTAKAALKAFAALMGLPKDDYDLRSNKGGIAVSGEVILHSDTVYIQVCADGEFNSNGGILFRRCKGRSDYGGERNCWANIHLLNNPEEMKKEIGWIFNPKDVSCPSG